MWERMRGSPWMQCALVALVAACVYLPLLGVRPLDMSEGHRAVPGWTMLESGDFWHQKMFGLTYVRKPPGIAWAIAGSGAVLGESTFSARLPSALAAIVMSVLAWWYGGRWFGRDGDWWAGIAAGLAQALMPLMWSPGRTAEIEMLNNVGTQMFALGMLDLLVRRARAGSMGNDAGPLGAVAEMLGAIGGVVIPSAGLLIAAMAKGPASVPVLAGVVVGACVARKSARPLVERGVWAPLIFGLGAAVVLLLKFQIANNTPDAVREDVAGQFLWSTHRVVGVLTLVPMAAVSALPTSLALLGPALGRTTAGATPEQERIARALAWAWIASVGVLMLAGVSNARYAMPAAVLAPALVPYTLAVLVRRGRSESPSSRWARVLLLGGPRSWAVVLVVGAGVFVAATSVSPSKDQRAGVAAAGQLGALVHGGELWADDAIEARPDVLWMMQKNAPSLRVRWARSKLAAGELPEPGGYLLLRTDANSGEGVRYAPAAARLVVLGHADIRGYQFTLYQVRETLGEKP